MYKIFTDKGKLFKCNIDISGATLDDCYARILLETEEKTFLYKGKVNKNGICEVEIPKLKNMFNEGVEGKIKLEVIVENTLFNPWESDFVVTASKKVDVHVEEEEEMPIKESKNDDKMKVSIIMDEEDEEVKPIKKEEKILEKEEIKSEDKKVIENKKNDNKKIINSKDDSLEGEIFDFESFFNKK
jgi:hypothetical protein